MYTALFKPKTEISKRAYLSLGIAGILSLLFVWAFITFSGLANELFLSNPVETFFAMVELFTVGNIIADIEVSVLRVFAGFLLAALIGIPLGVFIGTFRSVDAFTNPSISLIRFIPPAAFVPLAIVWFGIGDLQKLAIIFFGTFPFIVLYVSNAVANIEKKLFYSGYSLGANTRKVLSKIVLPKALPEIYDICRIELGGAWSLVILAEIVASTVGIGHRLVLAQRFLQTSTMIAEIIIILAIGLAVDQAFRKGYKIFFPWTEKARVE